MPTLLLLNGPNLNLLGAREPDIYGTTTLADVERDLGRRAAEAGAVLETFQSNHEGALIDRIQQARGKADVIIFNPGGLTHTSVALADAIAGVGIPTIEIHISNIYQREPFRHHSCIAPVAVGQIAGFGAYGYTLALEAALELISRKK